MRHNKKKHTLGREKAHREAMMRNLSDSLLVHGSVVTTLAKAKALRTVVEPLITKAKKGDINARRLIIKKLYTDEAVNKIMNDIAPKYKDRKGGYTRIIKLGRRSNDKAEMAKIELV
ncbi:MAG: 50S ribosomal protein L17 [Candidatus Magasanikbacteria bacterium]|nr:50S ribosomal protein L17 [Candidatus Magasanikbacteria bacterium]